MAKKVVVTGAAGYIGHHVVSELVRLGADVIAVDCRKVDAPSNVNWAICDLFNDEEALHDILAAKPDVCLHLAWRNGFKHNDDSHLLDLSGHYAFLKAVAESGVKQIAVMGSMHEVGYWEGPITADTPCNPLSKYGVAKDALRKASFLLAKELNFSLQWLRGFYIYGDDSESQSIFGKLLRADKAGETHFPFTSGKNKYDFLEVKELASQIARCVLQDEVSGIINCCSGDPVSLGEKIESFIKENGLSIQLDYGKFPDRPYDSPGVWGDDTQIKKILK